MSFHSMLLFLLSEMMRSDIISSIPHSKIVLIHPLTENGASFLKCSNLESGRKITNTFSNTDLNKIKDVDVHLIQWNEE